MYVWLVQTSELWAVVKADTAADAIQKWCDDQDEVLAEHVESVECFVLIE